MNIISRRHEFSHQKMCKHGKTFDEECKLCEEELRAMRIETRTRDESK